MTFYPYAFRDIWGKVTETEKTSDLVCYMQEVKQFVCMILFIIEQLVILSGAKYFPRNLFQ